MISLERRSRVRLVVLALVTTTLAAGSAGAEGTFFKKKREAKSAPASVTAKASQQPPAQPADQPPVQTTPVPSTTTQPAAVEAQPISGQVDQVVSTDRLVVAGQVVRLAGVIGEGGNVDGLTRWLAGNGNQVTCDPVGNGYRCRVPRGTDVGEIVVLNGAGRTDANAPPEYRQAEMQARAQSKGIWAPR